jgi:hypothetical protein
MYSQIVKTFSLPLDPGNTLLASKLKHLEDSPSVALSIIFLIVVEVVVFVMAGDGVVVAADDDIAISDFGRLFFIYYKF